MFRVEPCPLPDEALLARYRRNGAFTDCYVTDVPGAVPHARYVQAFYTTWVFRLERLILRWAVAKPSTDAEARLLADGAIDSFAAWRVEARTDRQLLMADFQGRTRSWFMVAPAAGGAGTRLFFGSAVVPAQTAGPAAPAMPAGFRLLMRFHKLYSHVLLHAAASRLKALGRA